MRLHAGYLITTRVLRRYIVELLRIKSIFSNI